MSSGTVEVKKGRFSVGQVQAVVIPAGQTVSSPPLMGGQPLGPGKSPTNQPLSPAAIFTADTPSPPHAPETLPLEESVYALAASPPANRVSRLSGGAEFLPPSAVVEAAPGLAAAGNLSSQPDAKKSRFVMMASQQFPVAAVHPVVPPPVTSTESSGSSSASSLHASTQDISMAAPLVPPLKDDCVASVEAGNASCLPPAVQVGSPPLASIASGVLASAANAPNAGHATLERLRRGRFEVSSTANPSNATATPMTSGTARTVLHGQQLSETGSLHFFDTLPQCPSDSQGYGVMNLPSYVSPNISHLDLKTGEEARQAPHPQSRFVVAQPPSFGYGGRAYSGKLSIGTGQAGGHHAPSSSGSAYWGNFVLPSAASGVVSLTGLGHPAVFGGSFSSPVHYPYGEGTGASPVAVDLVQSTIDQLYRSMDYSRTLLVDLAHRIPYVTHYGNPPPLLHTPAFSENNLGTSYANQSNPTNPSELGSDGFECSSVVSEAVDEKLAPTPPVSSLQQGHPHQRHTSNSMPDLVSASSAATPKHRPSASTSSNAANLAHANTRGPTSKPLASHPMQAPIIFKVDNNSTIGDVTSTLSLLERHLQLLFRENEHLRASNDFFGKEIDSLRRENAELKREIRDGKRNE